MGIPEIQQKDLIVLAFFRDDRNNSIPSYLLIVSKAIMSAQQYKVLSLPVSGSILPYQMNEYP